MLVLRHRALETRSLGLREKEEVFFLLLGQLINRFVNLENRRRCQAVTCREDHATLRVALLKITKYLYRLAVLKCGW